MCVSGARSHSRRTVAGGALYWPALLQQAVTDPLAFNQMLEALLRFSLVKRLAADQLSIHRLVQVVQVRDESRQRSSVSGPNGWCVPSMACFLVSPEKRSVPGRGVCAIWSRCKPAPVDRAASVTVGWRQRICWIEPAPICVSMRPIPWPKPSICKHCIFVRSCWEHGILRRRAACTIWVFFPMSQGKYEEAESYYQRALAIREEQLGAPPSETAGP